MPVDGWSDSRQFPPSFLVWPQGYPFPLMTTSTSPHLLNESIVDFAIPKTIKTENREFLSHSPPRPPTTTTTTLAITSPQSQTNVNPTSRPPTTSSFYNALGRPYL
jgi:hypothetical protein